MLAFAEIYVGDDVNQLCLITKNGLPVDISSADTITVTMTNDPDKADETGWAATQDWTLADGTLTLDSINQGGIFLTPSTAETTLLLPVVQKNLDFVVVISGKAQTYRVPQGLSVLARET